MVKHWLSQEDSIKYLSKAFYGHLATTNDHQPYIVPVNFVYYQNHIYIHSSLNGQKLENIKNNSRVCFEVSHFTKLLPGNKPCQFGVCYWSVLVFGQAKILDNMNLKTNALHLLIKKYCQNEYFSPLAPENIQQVAIIDINIDRISGKANIENKVEE